MSANGRNISYLLSQWLLSHLMGIMTGVSAVVAREKRGANSTVS